MPALRCDWTNAPVVCVVYLVHAEITLDNHTLPILLDHNLVFPIGVLIGYVDRCQCGQRFYSMAARKTNPSMATFQT